MLRPTALFPLLCCIAALILSFLCLFAGNKRNFMEDYHLLTLNTSQIGSNLVNGSLTDGSNSFEQLINEWGQDAANEINDAVNSIASEVGLMDWYSVHILDYCEGWYSPTSVANATVHSGEIHKNVTWCSKRDALFHFNPTKALQQSLNESGVDITLDDLDWPDDIQKGLDAVKVASMAMFVLYCIAIGLIFISMCGSVLALVASGRLAALVNILVAILAFLAIGLASALATAIIVKASNAINKYGNAIGVEAHRGTKFMAITWASTGIMFLATVWWCGECIIGHRRRARMVTPIEKAG